MRLSLLWDSSGRLRSGWRLALWLTLVTTLGVLVRYVLGADRGLPPTLAAFALVVALPSVFLWQLVDGRRFTDTPLAPTRDAGRAFAIGLLAGIAMVGVAVAFLFAAGAYRVEARPCDAAGQTAFLVQWISIFALAAALEELLFRGYALFALRDGLGCASAVAFSAILFSLGHAGNPYYGWPAAVAIAWIGALLAAWVLVSGTMWGAFGIHVGWNAALAVGAAIPVSGLRIVPPCYMGMVEGPTWLTGGAFGLEGGVLAAVLWGAAGAAIAILEVRRRSG